MTVQGFDMYEGSAAVDFSKEKENGYAFSIHKAVEGATYHDSKFADNYKAARAAGQIVGAYGFARPSTSKAVDEANALIETVKANGGFMLPPIFDVEDAGGLSDAELQTYVTDWRLTVQKVDARKPILYIDLEFYQKLEPVVGDFVLWIAEYGVETPQTPDWVFWQKTAQGRIEGGTFDIDVFNGTLEQIQALARIEPAPQTKQPEPAPETASEPKPEPAPETASTRTGYASHVVASGDTLSALALKYKTPMDVLQKFNSIADASHIEVGETIYIPNVYRVKGGDTLSALCEVWKESIADVATWNTVNPDRIYVGQVLFH